MRLLYEEKFSGEEIFEIDRSVLVQVCIGCRLKRKSDVHSVGVVFARTPVAGLHDPGAGTGDHSPAVFGHGPPKLDGQFVIGVAGIGAGRAIDGDLWLAMSGEDKV